MELKTRVVIKHITAFHSFSMDFHFSYKCFPFYEQTKSVLALRKLNTYRHFSVSIPYSVANISEFTWKCELNIIWKNLGIRMTVAKKGRFNIEIRSFWTNGLILMILISNQQNKTPTWVKKLSFRLKLKNLQSSQKNLEQSRLSAAKVIFNFHVNLKFFMLQKFFRIAIRMLKIQNENLKTFLFTFEKMTLWN